MIENIRKVSNPLTVIAIFAGLAEVSGTVVLPFLKPDEQSTFVWFLILFPTLLVVLFFATLNWHHKVLYAPTDYRDDRSFLETIRPLNSKEQESRLRQAVEESAQIRADLSRPAPPPGTPPGVRVPSPSESRAALMATIMQAEDLSLKEIQADTGLSLQREMGIKGEPDLHFDALSVDRERRTLTAVEVKFLRTADFPQRVIQHALRMGDVFAQKVMAVGDRPRFILAIVTDVDDVTHAYIRRRVDELARQAQFPPDTKVFRLAELKSKYGLDDAANNGTEPTR